MKTCNLLSEEDFKSYIGNSLSEPEYKRIKKHLNRCKSCWANWNIFRWNIIKDTQTYHELKEYLDHDFVEYIDASWALALDWKSRNPTTIDQIEQFYRETPFYVYNLMIWEETKQRPRYVDLASEALNVHKCRVICDFGCGIGNDGLKLLEKGYDVIFCDFDNPSTKFLRWRLKKRGISAKYIEPYDLDHIRGFDTLWAMDVIEHLPNPYKTLDPFLAEAKIYIHATDGDSKSYGRQPFHIRHPQKYLRALYHLYGYKRNVGIDQIEVWQRG